ncbi:MAG: TIGR03668 family PPOX class F420-dependent oxidoreductase [Chloroflexota bacterium]|nr:TIGR03668 family PPOX class F420-dependent oxidoreductase [Chloroflexota bacterium]
MLSLTPEQVQRLAAAPVGRLSTAGKSGAPHVIPVCFALDEEVDGVAIYIALDQKPKRAALTRLRRVRNILENPQVALVVDHYDPDWTKLWYILLTGAADLLEDGAGEAEERRKAVRLLRQKYPQYLEMDIDDNPVIRITPHRATAWSYTPEKG